MENQFKRKRSASSDELNTLNKKVLSGARLKLSVLTVRSSSAPLIEKDVVTSPRITYSNSEHIYPLIENESFRFRQQNTPSRKPELEARQPKASVSTHVSTPGRNGPDEEPNKRNLELYKEALDRLNEIQQSLSEEASIDSEDESDLQDHLDGVVGPVLKHVSANLDAETLGFLVCAQETMKYLHEQGVTPTDPIFTNLRNRFVRGLNHMGFE